jgi:hypothetical protein
LCFSVKNDSNYSVPPSGKGRKGKKQGLFLDKHLVDATREALGQRFAELKCLSAVGNAVARARQMFGQSPDWLRRFDDAGFRAHLAEALQRCEGERELFAILTGEDIVEPKGGTE